ETVALVETGAKIGGFMSPINWDGHWIDKGPQFFDNFEPQDVDLMTEMVGPDIMEEVGFDYGSFTGGALNCDFAIPDWQALGEDTAHDAFHGLFKDRVLRSGHVPAFNTLDDLLVYDGGPTLYPHLVQLTKKFLRRDANEVSPRAASMVSYLGRKKFFDQETSVNLKKSPLLDGLLAAKKMSVGESRANLYPRGSSLETVRRALEVALEREGVTVFSETTLSEFDGKAGIARGDGIEIGFGRVFFGTDVRDSENILTGGRTISDKTHALPEIFHCFVVPAESVAKPYYVVDYDPDHLTSRITSFCNYMGCVDDEGNGVICAEEPVDVGDDRWNDPAGATDRIFEEAKATGTVQTEGYLKAKSFKIPVTYKFPLVGIDGPIDQFFGAMNARFGDRIILPDPYGLTRKEAIDDLRKLGLLA
ncbi:MAG: hypothetical protein ACR2O1_09605, partial [Boseongicola sp.]